MNESSTPSIAPWPKITAARGGCALDFVVLLRLFPGLVKVGHNKNEVLAGQTFQSSGVVFREKAVQNTSDFP